MYWNKYLFLSSRPISVWMFARYKWVIRSSVGSEILFHETWLNQEDPFKQVQASKEDKEE